MEILRSFRAVAMAGWARRVLSSSLPSVDFDSRGQHGQLLSAERECCVRELKAD